MGSKTAHRINSTESHLRRNFWSASKLEDEQFIKSIMTTIYLPFGTVKKKERKKKEEC